MALTTAVPALMDQIDFSKTYTGPVEGGGISRNNTAEGNWGIVRRMTPAMRRGLQSLSQDAKTPMDHRAKLSIYSAPSQQRFSSVVCTIGPKAGNEKVRLCATFSCRAC